MAPPLGPSLIEATSEAASKLEQAVTPAERQMLARFDEQRRRNILRIIVPGLLILAIIALPIAAITDIQSQSFNSLIQDALGLIAFAISYGLFRARKALWSARVLQAGVSAVIVVVLIQDTLFSRFDLLTVPEFTLLILPISVAGLLLTPRAIIITTVCTLTLTALLLTFGNHATDLSAALERPNGAVLYTVPFSAQIVLSIFTYVVARTLGQTQRELNVVRVAYARERELDRLKELFIAGVNHELRTPIMALQNYLLLATEFGKNGEHERQAHLLQRSNEAVAHLAGLVESVLNVQRIEVETAHLSSQALDLLPIVQSAVELVLPLAEEGADRAITLAIPTDLQVQADPDRVRQVLLNLLTNAVKYSANGTPIAIAAHIPAASRQNGATVPAHAEIAVRDWGLGVPPDQQPLLFQRFVRLPRDLASPVKGTGLGLALCKAYVEAMGGTIQVASSGRAGEGSIFSFTLPLVAATSLRRDDGRP